MVFISSPLAYWSFTEDILAHILKALGYSEVSHAAISNYFYLPYSAMFLDWDFFSLLYLLHFFQFQVT